MDIVLKFQGSEKHYSIGAVAIQMLGGLSENHSALDLFRLRDDALYAWGDRVSCHDTKNGLWVSVRVRPCHPAKKYWANDDNLGEARSHKVLEAFKLEIKWDKPGDSTAYNPLRLDLEGKPQLVVANGTNIDVANGRESERH